MSFQLFDPFYVFYLGGPLEMAVQMLSLLQNVSLKFAACPGQEEGKKLRQMNTGL